MESATVTLPSAAGTVERLTPAPYSSWSGAVRGWSGAPASQGRAAPRPMALRAETRV